MSRVAVVDVGEQLVDAVEAVFAPFGLDKLLAGRNRAYIKVNAIDCRPETYTSPAVLEALIKVLHAHGVKQVTVMENCTQGNFTRMVFAATELGAVCKRNRARVLYLDEHPVTDVDLPGLDQKARFPRVLMEELARKERTAVYINLPKLKTHSMSVVTLGIKNQLGFMDQSDRMQDHNHRLHGRLAAVAELFRPDFTIVDGLNAVYHGHYPPVSVLDRCLAPLNVLVGGTDMLAVDTVAARILGYTVEEVEHLRLARERNLGCGDLDEIDVVGNLSRFSIRYPYTLLPDMPPDVEIIRGKERCCIEGCRMNTEAVLQFLFLDHQGKGGFTILMGQGLDHKQLQAIRGRVLVVGGCAAEEAAPLLGGCDKVYTSPACNDLAATVKGLTKLMQVSPLKLVPLSPLRSLALLAWAKLNGSRARVGL